MIDKNLNPKASLDKQRWQWVGNKTIEIENNFDKKKAKELEKLGHNIIRKSEKNYFGYFGRGQIIFRNENNILYGACEPRTDSGISVF